MQSLSARERGLKSIVVVLRCCWYRRSLHESVD